MQSHNNILTLLPLGTEIAKWCPETGRAQSPAETLPSTCRLLGVKSGTEVVPAGLQRLEADYKAVTDKEKEEVVKLGGLHVVGTERHVSHFTRHNAQKRPLDEAQHPSRPQWHGRGKKVQGLDGLKTHMSCLLAAIGGMLHTQGPWSEAAPSARG